MEKLAKELYAFVEEYDPYHFKDIMDEGEEESVEKILNSIKNKDCEYIFKWFVTALREMDDTQKDTATRLVQRLSEAVNPKCLSGWNLGKEIYENIYDFDSPKPHSYPCDITEIHQGYLIAFEKHNQISLWIDECFLDLFSEKPKYELLN